MTHFSSVAASHESRSLRDMCDSCYLSAETVLALAKTNIYLEGETPRPPLPFIRSLPHHIITQLQRNNLVVELRCLLADKGVD
jgi:hypothetical protein